MEARGAGAAGAAFPRSVGDRELGKFRGSDVRRQTTVAVVDDAGEPLAHVTNDLLGQILTQLHIQNAHLALVTSVTLGEEDLPTEVA